MLKELFKYLKKPKLYAPGTCVLWTDDHISKGMLEAHLAPKTEGASRCHDFIDRSVEWIAEVAPSSSYPNLLDLGCGPGLYAERLYRKGYQITGIDFSKRSIAYAKKKASDRHQNINYIYKNYLEIDYDNEFDIITLIYCDFCALTDEQRTILLNKIVKSLKKGGKLIFDVFTMMEFVDRKESNTWYVTEGSCFFKPHGHLCLESHFIYDEDVRLTQYVIIDKDERVDVIRDWLKYFTQETIITELKNAGFNKFQIYSDVTGKPYSNGSKTMCIVVEK